MTPQALFERHFLPLYPPDARNDLARARTTDANPAENPALYAEIDEAAAIFAALAPAALGEDPELDFSDASVHRLSALLTRERRDRLSAETAADGSSQLLSLVIHGALYVGACVSRNHGGRWQVRRPLWESLVRLHSAAGTGDLAIFHWWLKALSDEEIGRGRLGERYRTHVEVPCFDAAALPRIAPPDRKIPRLAKVRYDTLHKHLRAHLPELRDVGEDFPSPERLEELGLRWLEARLVGGGRMALLHGPGEGGVHLFWLDARGFQKAAFYAAETFPAHLVELEGDRMRVLVPIAGETRIHEMLWWGP